jgi:uncharacterized repeat protein (TIGR03803 family)
MRPLYRSRFRIIVFLSLAATSAYAQTYMYEVVRTFNTNNGENPVGGLVRDSAGNLYGTAENGGKRSHGVVFKLSAGKETVLYTFTGGVDGGGPDSGVISSPTSLIRDSTGNLYGTAYQGGTANQGVVFKLDTANNYTVLYNFCSLVGCSDGLHPLTGGLYRDSDGNLYGTAGGGGAYGQGVVFKLDTDNNYSILYNFTGGADGSTPFSGVVRDSNANLYGTTAYGGTAGVGVAYKLSPSGKLTVLHTFTGGLDGSIPTAGLIFDSSGNLYGTAEGGGAGGQGVVFKLTRTGQQTVLYNFTGGADGAEPSYGPLIRDSAGNLYGTAESGGTGGGGVVYQLDTANSLHALYSFTGGADGGRPCAGLSRDSAGNLYGTTFSGGSAGYGVAYKLKFN